jgi:nitrogen regulatory protein PII
MKFVVAVIQSDRLNEVLELLVEKEVHLVTVMTVMG